VRLDERLFFKQKNAVQVCLVSEICLENSLKKYKIRFLGDLEV